MAGESSMGDEERLRKNVRAELAAQNAVRDLGLAEATLDGLADSVAANLLHAFDVRWAPKWVKPGEAHYWWEPSTETRSGEEHFVECLQCSWVCAANDSRRAAEQKFGRHKQNEHSSSG